MSVVPAGRARAGRWCRGCSRRAACARCCRPCSRARRAPAGTRSSTAARCCARCSCTSPCCEFTVTVPQGRHTTARLYLIVTFSGSRMKASSDEECNRGGYPSANECEERSSVELAVAPHLPLLHHALLHDPANDASPVQHVSTGRKGPYNLSM